MAVIACLADRRIQPLVPRRRVHERRSLAYAEDVCPVADLLHLLALLIGYGAILEEDYDT